VNASADSSEGDADLFVAIDGAPNRLYRNDDGTFRDVASLVGIADARSPARSRTGCICEDRGRQTRLNPHAWRGSFPPSGFGRMGA
jgi:hypothetical protein